LNALLDTRLEQPLKAPKHWIWKDYIVLVVSVYMA
jgi:hypothetical protein